MDCSLSGSSVHGIFQARVLEWIAISFSRGSSRPRNHTLVSRIAGRCFTVWATRDVSFREFQVVCNFIIYLSLWGSSRLPQAWWFTGRIHWTQKLLYSCCVLLSCFSHVQSFATLWTVAHWTPLSIGFSKKEYWSGLPCPPPGDLSIQGIEPIS